MNFYLLPGSPPFLSLVVLTSPFDVIPSLFSSSLSFFLCYIPFWIYATARILEHVWRFGARNKVLFLREHSPVLMNIPPPLFLPSSSFSFFSLPLIVSEKLIFSLFCCLVFVLWSFFPIGRPQLIFRVSCTCYFLGICLPLRFCPACLSQHPPQICPVCVPFFIFQFLP